MSRLSNLFKKNGGFTLVKDYINQGVLCYALSQIAILGKSDAALQLLRKGVSIKLRKKLNMQFKNEISRFVDSYNELDFEHERPNKIWFCWMQGIEKAPALVQKCYASLAANIKDKEIVLLTSENYLNYAPNIPDYILEKYKNGLITHTHFSDILRIELLAEHGGTWIDATVFCSGSNIPKYMLDSDLFIFQNLKPGSNGSVNNISSWFITSMSHHKIIMLTRDLLRSYWKKNDSLINYFLIHHFVSMSINAYKKDFNDTVIAYPNSIPHILLLMLFDEFNQEKWDAVTSVCPFHKLAYKRSAEEMAKPNTYYQYIMNHG